MDDCGKIFQSITTDALASEARAVEGAAVSPGSPRTPNGVPTELHCLYTFPSFITNCTCSSTLMSCNGSPATAIRSAYLPGLMSPTTSECPSRSAAEVVADWMACIDVIPYLTMKANCFTLRS